MPNLRDIYSYESPKYAPLREPARKATEACQNAARALDALKEWVLIEYGLVNTAEAIHALAHRMPPFFDRIGNILHQRHLMQEYPATPEYELRPETLDEVFSEVIRLLQDNENALKDCVKVCDELGLWALARDFESLEIDNSRQYEKFMLAWQMYDQTDNSATSFDNWMLHLFEEGGGG